jgi:hypothetical protein
MILHNRFAVVFEWTGLAVLTTACGQSAFSPTSPSGNGRGGSSGTAGATITGSVDGVQPSIASSSEAVAMASKPVTKPVTVTVVGTSISTTIDGAGRFQLNDVPVGDVQLKFVGTGLDATLTVKGVEAGDLIDLRVRFTDSSVRIEAERRERRRGDDDKLKGTVAALSGTCPTIMFTVSGVTVKTSSATRFEDGWCAGVLNNARVEIQGRRQTDGSIQADRIEVEH